MTADLLRAAADAAHLTKALRKVGALGESSVRHVALEKSFATVLSHIFHLRLTYDSAAVDAPASLILKAGLPGRPGGPWMVAVMRSRFTGRWRQRCSPATFHAASVLIGIQTRARGISCSRTSRNLISSRRSGRCPQGLENAKASSGRERASMLRGGTMLVWA